MDLALVATYLREVLAVVLLVAFAILVAAAGFMWCLPAGLAATGLICGAAGIILGLN